MKKYSLLFMVSILFSSQISQCSWSWWETVVKAPLQSISQSISPDTAKKLFPFAILVATVVGFYYWMSKKDQSSRNNNASGPLQVSVFPQAQTSMLPSSLTKVIRAVVKPKKQEPILYQYQVYNQTRSDGGGPASCGYHALLRSMQIVQAKSQYEKDEELKKTLMNTISIEVYFGTGPKQIGEWRDRIIIERKKKILKNELHAKFLAALIRDKDKKTQELYKSAIGHLEQIIIRLVDDIALGNEGYEFTNDAIKHYIREGLQKITTPENVQAISELEQSAIMKENLSISGIQKGVQAEEGVLRVADLVQEISSRPGLQSDLKGDWLDDGEIEYLWNYENEKRSAIIPRDVVCQLKTVANPDYIGMEGFDEVTPFVQEQIQQYWKENKDQQKFLLFTIGQGMQQQGDMGRTSGHWYGLVIHQDSEGNRYNYIMDSMGDDRTKDANALKIINVFEKELERSIL